ncbi:MAG: hypothetical protein LBQ46_10015 [Treponema sp.]|jgi:hypothetical protein|nr:hypothetical protein [Treponema sp.]
MKSSLILAVVTLVLCSCSIHYRDTAVVNDSGIPVSFTLGNYDTRVITLNPGESSFSGNAYTNLSNLEPAKRVVQQLSNTDERYTISIVDRPSWKLRVNNNTLPNNVTLSADGWMDEMPNIKGGAADDSNHTGIIYTDTPVFSASYAGTDFPLRVEWEIIDDVMWVTIG